MIFILTLVIKYILLGIHNVGGATIIVAACAALSYLLFGGLFGSPFALLVLLMPDLVCEILNILMTDDKVSVIWPFGPEVDIFK